MSKPRIQRVCLKKLMDVIDHRTPLGLFLTKEGRTWVAVDNSAGDAWTEDFDRKRQAIRWLRGEFEVGDQAERWDMINDAESLIRVAIQQGVGLNTREADMILGYFEGHDYCLMVGAGGRTMRHDEQDGDDHRGDEPYTVQDAVGFCQEMNDDLLHEDCLDERFLSQLRKDERVLDALIARLTYT